MKITMKNSIKIFKKLREFRNNISLSRRVRKHPADLLARVQLKIGYAFWYSIVYKQMRKQEYD